MSLDEGTGAPAPAHDENPEDRDARPTLRDKFLTAMAEKAERLRREGIARAEADTGIAPPADVPPAGSETAPEGGEAPAAADGAPSVDTGAAGSPEPPAPATEQPAEGATVTPAAAGSVPAASAAASPPAPSRRPIEINGVTYQVTDDELVQLARTGGVAIAAMRQAQPASEPPLAAPAPEPPKPVITREAARDVVKRLAYGSEDEGAEAIERLVNGIVAQPAPAPAVNPQQIAMHAAAIATQQVRLQNDLATIGAEFPDVFADRYRSEVARLALQEIVQRDIMLQNARPDIDRMREAAQTVRASMTQAPAPRPAGNGVSAAPQAAPSASPEADKLARKRAAPQMPTGTGRAMPAAAMQPRTNSEIVAQMRRDRGLPVTG